MIKYVIIYSKDIINLYEGNIHLVMIKLHCILLYVQIIVKERKKIFQTPCRWCKCQCVFALLVLLFNTSYISGQCNLVVTI